MKLVRYEDDATEAQAFLSGQVDIFSTAEMIVRSTQRWTV
jgi:polar amino acid transport system substrate-binding protein